MIPSRRPCSLAASILAVLGGRSPAQAGSRCLQDPKENVRCTVVSSEPRRMNRPQVDHFLSGVLAYFPSGARKGRARRRQEKRETHPDACDAGSRGAPAPVLRLRRKAVSECRAGAPRNDSQLNSESECRC